MGRSACIVVLGDIGRSPRMRYHALSLASHGLPVDIVAYTESKVPPDLAASPLIRIRSVPPPPPLLDKLPRSVALAAKLLFTGTMLLLTLLFRVGLPSFLFLQNPPGLPTLPVCYFVAKLKQSRLVVDWHNYTFSMLEYEMRERSGLVVRVAKGLEAFFGRRSWHSLCVTRAMRSDLERRWGVKAVNLYDRPTAAATLHYDTEQRHLFYHRLAAQLNYSPFMCPSSEEAAEGVTERTAFSFRHSDSGEAQLRSERPVLLVSGTSWTPDEDFSILLSALQKYDAQAALQADSDAAHRLPPILAVITGKGPMKAHYLDQMKRRPLERVKFFCPWLETQDYPRMLAAADVGVSLHASTSGLDLPMKVVDMLGVGLPVLAKKFPAIPELVKVGQNGLLFSTAQELADEVLSLLRGFPDPHHCRLFPLQSSVREQALVSWEDNWDAVVWPLLQSI